MDAPGRATDVQRLAGVLLEVCPLDLHPVRLAVDLDVGPSAVRDRLVVLGGLEVLRHVRVEVVLAREAAQLGDRAVQSEADPDRGLDGGLVDHGQGTGQPQAHRAHLRVRLGAEDGGAAAEHLADRAQLDMHLQSRVPGRRWQGVVVGHQRRGHANPSSSGA
jgi:hypothetical protein